MIQELKVLLHGCKLAQFGKKSPVQAAARP
jgi:hypothetical protein